MTRLDRKRGEKTKRHRSIEIGFKTFLSCHYCFQYQNTRSNEGLVVSSRSIISRTTRSKPVWRITCWLSGPRSSPSLGQHGAERCCFLLIHFELSDPSDFSDFCWFALFFKNNIKKPLLWTCIYFNAFLFIECQLNILYLSHISPPFNELMLLSANQCIYSNSFNCLHSNQFFLLWYLCKIFKFLNSIFCLMFIELCTKLLNFIFHNFFFLYSFVFQFSIRFRWFVLNNVYIKPKLQFFGDFSSSL
jgi:hypothetical protein